MRTSSNGVDLIKRFEGLRTESYLCPAHVWTIGYGSTGSDVKAGMKWTEQQCEARLEQDLLRFERSVKILVKRELTQGQFDALVSFTFNLGAGNLEKSTLLKKLNAGDVPGAADELLRWNKAGGKVLAGLTKRRVAERDLFLDREWR